jgi:hypothetical protein
MSLLKFSERNNKNTARDVDIQSAEVLPAPLLGGMEVLTDGSRYNIAFVSACNLIQLVRYIPTKCKPTFGVQPKPCGLCPWTTDLSVQLGICTIKQKQCSSKSLTLLSPSGLFVELLNRRFWHDPKRSKQEHPPPSLVVERVLWAQTLLLCFLVNLHSSGTLPYRIQEDFEEYLAFSPIYLGKVPLGFSFNYGYPYR